MRQLQNIVLSVALALILLTLGIYEVSCSGVHILDDGFQVLDSYSESDIVLSPLEKRALSDSENHKPGIDLIGNDSPPTEDEKEEVDSGGSETHIPGIDLIGDGHSHEKTDSKTENKKEDTESSSEANADPKEKSDSNGDHKEQVVSEDDNNEPLHFALEMRRDIELEINVPYSIEIALHLKDSQASDTNEHNGYLSINVKDRDPVLISVLEYNHETKDYNQEGFTNLCNWLEGISDKSIVMDLNYNGKNLPDRIEEVQPGDNKSHDHEKVLYFKILIKMGSADVLINHINRSGDDISLSNEDDLALLVYGNAEGFAYYDRYYLSNDNAVSVLSEKRECLFIVRVDSQEPLSDYHRSDIIAEDDPSCMLFEIPKSFRSLFKREVYPKISIMDIENNNKTIYSPLVIDRNNATMFQIPVYEDPEDVKPIFLVFSKLYNGDCQFLFSITGPNEEPKDIMQFHKFTPAALMPAKDVINQLKSKKSGESIINPVPLVTEDKKNETVKPSTRILEAVKKTNDKILWVIAFPRINISAKVAAVTLNVDSANPTFMNRLVVGMVLSGVTIFFLAGGWMMLKAFCRAESIEQYMSNMVQGNEDTEHWRERQNIELINSSDDGSGRAKDNSPLYHPSNRLRDSKSKLLNSHSNDIYNSKYPNQNPVFSGGVPQYDRPGDQKAEFYRNADLDVETTFDDDSNDSYQYHYSVSPNQASRNRVTFALMEDNARINSPKHSYNKKQYQISNSGGVGGKRSRGARSSSATSPLRNPSAEQGVEKSENTPPQNDFTLRKPEINNIRRGGSPESYAIESPPAASNSIIRTDHSSEKRKGGLRRKSKNQLSVMTVSFNNKETEAENPLQNETLQNDTINTA